MGSPPNRSREPAPLAETATRRPCTVASLPRWSRPPAIRERACPSRWGMDERVSRVIQVSLRNGNGGGLIDGRADGWQGRDKKLMLGLEGSHCSTPAGGFWKITWLETRLLGVGDRLSGRLPVPHPARGTPPG